jgi:hypothetical protein
MRGVRTGDAPMSAPRYPARRAFVARALACVLAFAPLPRALAAEAGLGESDWQAIRDVIRRQLAALRAGDDARAFAYASPGIRAQFGDPVRFLSMVKSMYAALLVARYTEFLDGALVDGMAIQPLRLVAPDNTVLVAFYSLEKLPDGWRINGCRLAPSMVQAA